MFKYTWNICIYVLCRFPKDEEIRRQWVVNVRRENWKATDSSVLCSSHFEEGCFDRTGQTVRLRDGAIPTIFDFPQHLQPKPVKQRSSRTSGMAQLPAGELHGGFIAYNLLSVC